MMILFQPARKPSVRAEMSPRLCQHSLLPFENPSAATETEPLYDSLFSLGARYR